MNKKLLEKNKNGRFELGNAEITSGDKIKIKIDDVWVKGIIEHFDTDYVLLAGSQKILIVLHSGIEAELI